MCINLMQLKVRGTALWGLLLGEAGETQGDEAAAPELPTGGEGHWWGMDWSSIVLVFGYLSYNAFIIITRFI